MWSLLSLLWKQLSCCTVCFCRNLLQQLHSGNILNPDRTHTLPLNPDSQVESLWILNVFICFYNWYYPAVEYNVILCWRFTFRNWNSSAHRCKADKTLFLGLCLWACFIRHHQSLDCTVLPCVYFLFSYQRLSPCTLLLLLSPSPSLRLPLLSPPVTVHFATRATCGLYVPKPPRLHIISGAFKTQILVDPPQMAIKVIWAFPQTLTPLTDIHSHISSSPWVSCNNNELSFLWGCCSRVTDSNNRALNACGRIWAEEQCLWMFARIQLGFKAELSCWCFHLNRNTWRYNLRQEHVTKSSIWPHNLCMYENLR